MILELDAGNSGVKWRLIAGSGEIASSGRGVGESFNTIGLSETERPTRIRVVSVRGPDFEAKLRKEAVLIWGVLPEFAASAAASARVVNGYEVPSSLGADRWMAILAAYSDCEAACCVVDAGTAITLDVVAEAGCHRGGYIVPGMSLQRRMLEKSTSIRLSPVPDWSDISLGVSTSSAVQNGIVSMLSDWIACESRGRGKLYLTGGDAQVLSRHLETMKVEHQLVPDLVLNGLAHALP
ncbi:MAG: type III pantothenate kinase [Pseudomonadota bacterium]